MILNNCLRCLFAWSFFALSFGWPLLSLEKSATEPILGEEEQQREREYHLKNEFERLLSEKKLNDVQFDELISQIFSNKILIQFNAQQIKNHYKNFGFNALMYLILAEKELPYLSLEQRQEISIVIARKFPTEFVVLMKHFIRIMVISKIPFFVICESFLVSKLISHEVKLCFYKHIYLPSGREMVMSLMNIEQGNNVDVNAVDNLISIVFLQCLVQNLSVAYFPVLAKKFRDNPELNEILHSSIIERINFQWKENFWIAEGPKAIYQLASIASDVENNFIFFVDRLKDDQIKSYYLLSLIKEISVLLEAEIVYEKEFLCLFRIFVTDIFNHLLKFKFPFLLDDIFCRPEWKEFLIKSYFFICNNFSPEEQVVIKNTLDETLIDVLKRGDYSHYSKAILLHNKDVIDWLININSLTRIDFPPKDQEYFSAYYSWLSSFDSASLTERSQHALPLLWHLLHGQYFEIYYQKSSPKIGVSIKTANKVVSWQGPYADGIKVDDEVQAKVVAGNSLIINERPIGYNVYFPDDEQNIKRVVVSVYGGHTKFDRIKKANMPSKMIGLEKMFLENQTMYIELNLCDLLFNEIHQTEIDASFKKLLHEDINSFFQQLKNNPSALHPDLSIIFDKNLPLFLSGTSFGGGLTAEHAGIYPNSWAGYLSFNGAVAEYKEHQLNPTNTIAQVTDPLLLSANCFDSRVSFKQLLVCQEQANKYENTNIQSYCNLNPLPLNITEPSLTGHFFPNCNPEDAEQYLQAILAFMDGRYVGDKKTFALSQVSSYTESPHATLEEMFQGEIWRRGLTNGTSTLSDDDLSGIYLSLKFVKDNEHQLIEKFSKIFEAHLTEDHLRKGLDREIDKFIDFTEEALDVDWLTPQYSSLLLRQYKVSLLQKFWRETSNFRKICSFLLANLDLVRDLLDDKNDEGLFAARKDYRDAWIKREIGNYERWRKNLE